MVDLGSPLPYYAALLRPALLPFLPFGTAPADAVQQRQVLERIAEELTPLMDKLINKTEEHFEAIAEELTSLVPANATDKLWTY